MAEELDRFSLILGPGEKIEESKLPKKEKAQSTKRAKSSIPAGKVRYRLRNLSNTTLVLGLPRSIYSAGTMILRKGAWLYVDCAEGALRRTQAKLFQDRVQLSITKLDPPAEGSVVYLQPDGSCSTKPPKLGDTAVKFGYILPVGSTPAGDSKLVTMNVDVDGFDTNVMVEGTAYDQDTVIRVVGGEVSMYSAGGERLDPNGSVGSSGPYGLGNAEEEQQENEVESLLDLMDEY